MNACVCFCECRSVCYDCNDVRQYIVDPFTFRCIYAQANCNRIIKSNVCLIYSSCRHIFVFGLNFIYVFSSFSSFSRTTKWNIIFYGFCHWISVCKWFVFSLCGCVVKWHVNDQFKKWNECVLVRAQLSIESRKLLLINATIILHEMKAIDFSFSSSFQQARQHTRHTHTEHLLHIFFSFVVISVKTSPYFNMHSRIVQ